MSRIAIVYNSKGGHSAKYAKWLKEELDAEVFNEKTTSMETILGYELLIIGGGVYNDKINGLVNLKKNIGAFMFRKMIVFAVGWEEDTEKYRKWLIEKNFAPEMVNRVPLFLLPGGIDKKTINPAEMIVLAGVKAKVQKKTDRTVADIHKLSMIDGMNDYTEKENLKEIIEYVKSEQWKNIVKK